MGRYRKTLLYRFSIYFLLVWSGVASALIRGDACPEALTQLCTGPRDRVFAAFIRKDGDFIVPPKAPVLNESTGDPSSSGDSNLGIYSVRQKSDGRVVALKFIAARILSGIGQENSVSFDGEDLRHRGFLDYLFIHKTLSDLGYVPRLHGVLSSSEAKKTLRKIRAMGREVHIEPTVAIAMEQIAKPWNWPRNTGFPPGMRSWSLATLNRLVGRIREFQNVLNQRRIYAQDVQLFFYEDVNGDPHVMLGDIDRYRLVRDGELNDFTQDIDGIIRLWESATGQVYSQHSL